jgi:polyferredoxin
MGYGVNGRLLIDLIERVVHIVYIYLIAAGTSLLGFDIIGAFFVVGLNTTVTVTPVTCCKC